MIVTNSQLTHSKFGRTLVIAGSILAMLVIASCGSTKVYNNDKTIVYNGAMYNVSKAKQINAKSTAKLSDGNTVSTKGADRKQIEAYLDEHESIFVRMAFEFDDQEMLYRANSVDSWKAYSNMNKSFEKAGK